MRPYHARMTRRADPELIHQARRAAIRNRLLAREAGKVWIDAQCAARKRPP